MPFFIFFLYFSGTPPLLNKKKGICAIIWLKLKSTLSYGNFVSCFKLTLLIQIKIKIM